MQAVTALRPAPAGSPPMASGPATLVAALAGAAVALVATTALLATDVGLYAVDGAALGSGLASAGLALFFVLPGAAEVRPVLRRVLQVLVTTAFAATALTVPFEIMAVDARGLTGLGDAVARDLVLRSDDFEAVLVRCVGLAAVALGVRVVGRRPLTLLPAICGAVIVAGSFVFTGHARTNGPGAVVVACALAHVLAAAAWFGGLVGLTLALRRVSGPRAGELLATFASLMTGIVTMLFAGGLGLAFLYLPSPDALLTTAYGQVLLVKLAVIGGLAVLAAANHRRLVPLAAKGGARELRVLRMNVTVEQIGLLAVVFITEVLMRQNPGG
jgi:copper transport protein